MAKKEKKKLDTYCEVCLQRQFMKKKIITCPKGHEGPEGISKEELERLQDKKKENHIKNHIYIQLGEDIDSRLYYHLIGSHGSFVLRAYRKDKEYNAISERTEIKEKVVSTYHADLQWIVKKILDHELTNQDACTLKQMLDILQSIDSRMEQLIETIYWLSNDQDNDDE